MNNEKMNEEELTKALIHLRALRMYGWAQMLWIALIAEAALILVLMILLFGKQS